MVVSVSVVVAAVVAVAAAMVAAVIVQTMGMARVVRVGGMGEVAGGSVRGWVWEVVGVEAMAGGSVRGWVWEVVGMEAVAGGSVRGWVWDIVAVARHVPLFSEHKEHAGTRISTCNARTELPSSLQCPCMCTDFTHFEILRFRSCEFAMNCYPCAMIVQGNQGSHENSLCMLNRPGENSK